jgi:hypothetical protein
MYRRIFLFCATLFFVFSGISDAQTITVKNTGNLIQASVNYGFTASSAKNILYVSKTPIGSEGKKPILEHQKEVKDVIYTSPTSNYTAGVQEYFVPDLPLSTTLYVNAVTIASDGVSWVYPKEGVKVVIGDTPNFIINLNPLVVSKTNIKASGVIDTKIYPKFKDFKLSYSVKRPEGDTKHTYTPTIDDKGGFSMSYDINELDEKTIYTVLLTVTSPGGTTDNKTFVQKFSKDKGYILPVTTKEGRNQFDAQTYRLLAPLPGLSLIRDTDLCLEYKASIVAQGGDEADIVCDINDFLNFLMKMAIAISAVVLIIRIIISGFSYMVTDIPFVKISSKDEIMTALGGLALALGAWVLLNTINPRLVSGGVELENVNFEVESFKELGIDYESNQKSFDQIGSEGASCDPTVKPAKINLSAKGYQYIKSDYLPAQEKAVPNASKGAKSLMTSQAMKEGFWPGTKAWRTNNPGNIGNRDDGSTNQINSLEDGIKRQLTLFTDIIQNKERNYKIGRAVMIPGGVGDDGKRYPALNFVYDGSICQYLSIYATGARHNTSYMSLIMGYFEINGMKITPKTKLSDIYIMK